jgi:SAM-dependent methyltransferase
VNGWTLDRFGLYELCVQSPRHVVSLLRAVHGNQPIVLREDFCGTAAVSRRWCEEASRAGLEARALAIDLDAESIARANAAALAAGVGDRVVCHVGDATIKEAPAAAEGSDVVFVGNFSIGYLHRRAALMRYLRYTLDRLRHGPAAMGGGVFACDLYGGAHAFTLGGTRRRFIAPSGHIVDYLWVHEEADPITAMVTNSISFEVSSGEEVIERRARDFVYAWRLWTIAELREAMLEVGFARVEVYKDLNVAPGEPATPVAGGAELGADWVVLIVGRA